MAIYRTAIHATKSSEVEIVGLSKDDIELGNGAPAAFSLSSRL